MHHQPRIPFRVGAITPVVMDAVPVKGKRRVPKQQHIIRMNDAIPCRLRRSRLRRRYRIARTRKVAIHNVVLLRQRKPAWRTDFMPHDNKHQRPTTPLLFVNADNPRDPCDLIPHAQRIMKFEAAPGPHPSRQIDRRQKSAPLWMPIRPELRLPLRRKKIQPVPQGRHSIPRTRRRIRAIKSSGQRLQRPRSYLIVPSLFAADPFFIRQAG